MDHLTKESSDIDISEGGSLSFSLRMNDPANAVSLSLAKKINDIIKPEKVALLELANSKQNEKLSSSKVGNFLVNFDVKVTSVSEQNNHESDEFDLALFITSRPSLTPDEKNLVCDISHASRLLVVTGTANTSNQQWMVAESQAALATQLSTNGFIRDFETVIQGLGYSATVFVNREKLNHNVSNLIANYEMNISLMSSEIRDLKILELEKNISTGNATVEDDQLSQIILAKNRQIKELELDLDDVTQKMYVAKDAVMGAQAEKARADGIAAEVRYLSDLKDQELSAALDELEALEEQGPNSDLHKGLVLNKKQKLLKIAPIRMLAKLTRPIRKRN